MWFSFDGHSFEIHNTEAEAKANAEDAMNEWEDDAADCGWNELSTQVCYGRVTHAVAVEPVMRDGKQVEEHGRLLERHTLERLSEDGESKQIHTRTSLKVGVWYERQLEYGGMTVVRDWDEAKVQVAKLRRFGFGNTGQKIRVVKTTVSIFQDDAP